MSITRWFIYASFAGGIITLSLQPSGMANAKQTSTVLVTDQSSESSQGQQGSRSGMKGMSEAESSGKMQRDKDAQPGGERKGKNSKIIDQSREQGTTEGSSEKDPNFGSGGASAPPSSSNSGMSEVGTGAGNR